MVHTKLIEQGMVEPLTYRQLRRLERMDARKAREDKLWQIGQATVLSTGYVLGEIAKAVGGAVQGFADNQNPISQGVALGAGIGALVWLSIEYPNFAKGLHLDALSGFMPNISSVADDTRTKVKNIQDQIVQQGNTQIAAVQADVTKTTDQINAEVARITAEVNAKVADLEKLLGSLF